MARQAASAKIDPALKAAVKKLLAEVMKEGAKVSLTDKCKAIDRGLKLAAIEAKLEDAGYGSGFSDSED